MAGSPGPERFASLGIRGPNPGVVSAATTLLRRDTEDTAIPRGKGPIRSRVRKGVAAGKLRPEERRTGRLAEPLACKRCGAVFHNRAWRRAATSRKLRAAITWVVCPACEQQANQVYLGRLVIDLGRSFPEEAALRRRIANVAATAGRTQPARRLVSVERRGPALEVLTTSEKLAHRITAELAKVWRGTATYTWSDDGSLFARWRPGRSA